MPILVTFPCTYQSAWRESCYMHKGIGLLFNHLPNTSLSCPGSKSPAKSSPTPTLGKCQGFPPGYVNKINHVLGYFYSSSTAAPIYSVLYVIQQGCCLSWYHCIHWILFCWALKYLSATADASALQLNTARPSYSSQWVPSSRPVGSFLPSVISIDENTRESLWLNLFFVSAVGARLQIYVLISNVVLRF